MTPQSAYQELTTKVREVQTLYSVASLLEWDQRTYMPPAGSNSRAAATSMLGGMAHEKMTSPRIGELLSMVESSDLVKQTDHAEAVNVREIRRSYDLATKLPKDLVEALIKETSLAQDIWQEARKKSDFAMFLPNLTKVIELTRQQADALGWQGERYNALLDQYEPGATAEEIAKVFEGLRGELVPMLAAIKSAKKQPDVTIVERAYDVEKQKIFSEMVAAACGFDFNAGRLDITTHPFCSGMATGDTRITTRYNPNRLNDALFGTMHETGHALYEMGLPKETSFGLPMAEAVSLGIHESQSRMWENQVGRSKAFWSYFLPQAQRIFRESLDGVSLDDFYGAVNMVMPSYIRVEADECTYNLHILLRFELERAIIKGEINLKDIPGEWNSRFEKYFGIKVPNDAKGCLQDVHWSAGLLGYFPTYTLGNLYSAQFFATATRQMPDMNQQFAAGNYAGLLTWLRKNIHEHGKRYRANDLVKKVTGEPLSSKYLLDYLKKKYAEIYGI